MPGNRASRRHRCPYFVHETRFAARLSRIRTLRCLTQADVADAVGISRQAVAQIEAGRRRITLAEALAIAAVLKVPVGDMLADRLTLRSELHLD